MFWWSFNYTKCHIVAARSILIWMWCQHHTLLQSNDRGHRPWKHILGHQRRHHLILSIGKMSFGNYRFCFGLNAFLVLTTFHFLCNCVSFIGLLPAANIIAYLSCRKILSNKINIGSTAFKTRKPSWIKKIYLCFNLWIRNAIFYAIFSFQIA